MQYVHEEFKATRVSQANFAIYMQSYASTCAVEIIIQQSFTNYIYVYFIMLPYHMLCIKLK